jgi:hypothetical protein
MQPGGGHTIRGRRLSYCWGCGVGSGANDGQGPRLGAMAPGRKGETGIKNYRRVKTRR